MRRSSRSWSPRTPLLPDAWRTACARIAATGCACLLAAACGSGNGSGALAPGGPWSAELAPVFDDSVDFVSPLRSILGTPWFEEYGAQLERRVDGADVVAVVRVRSILPATTGQGTGTLEVEVEEALRGQLAPGQSLRLDLDAGAAERLAEHRERVEQLERFVAYVRLFADPTGEIRNHWHLSPWDDDLVGTIRRVLQPPEE